MKPAILICVFPLITAFSSLPGVPPTFVYQRLANNVKSEVEQEQNLVKRVEQGCVRKAMYSENIALNKVRNIPLAHVIDNINTFRRHQQEVGETAPSYVYVEMQRIARDAYRRDFIDTTDIDRFAADVYSTCVKAGW